MHTLHSVGASDARMFHILHCLRYIAFGSRMSGFRSFPRKHTNFFSTPLHTLHQSLPENFIMTTNTSDGEAQP